ncbi:MAG: hypothetical protein JWO83_2494 [Caulobacteraceae bacterium]|jgi:hypothetical protein|nr:hypothetical protein [Caulobacteraceae bacterium]
MRALIASRAATLALAALALTACENNGGTMVNSKLCPDFKAPAAGAPAVVATDAAAPVDECVRRWAFSLAGSRDEAEVVANAAVAACGAALTRWNQASLTQPTQDSTGGPTQILSLDTGQPTNALAEHNAFAQRQALLYVVEARAGHCRPPPVVKGAPVGV